MSSLSKVGYGDIIAVNLSEKIYVSFLNAFGLLMLGWFISKISLLVNLNFKKNNKFLSKINNITAYL